MVYFTVEYIISKWEEDGEPGYEVLSTQHLHSGVGDIGEEFGSYMPVTEEAQESLKNVVEGVYKVFITGTLDYRQDSWGEIDVNSEVERLHSILLNPSVDEYLGEVKYFTFE